MILDVDLAQIEWRVAAALSQDQIMIKELWDGVDQHTATCVNLMELPLNDANRSNAKIFNFRAIYCDPATGWYGYYMDPKMPNFSQEKWKNILTGFFQKYSGLSAAHQEWIREVRRTGLYRGPTGRIWEFKKLPQKGGYLDYSERQIRNYPVQGTACDLAKLALIFIRKELKGISEKIYLTNVVHDSIIIDVEEKHVEKVARICLKYFRELPELAKKYFNWEMNVPIDGDAEAGLSWGDVEKLKI